MEEDIKLFHVDIVSDDETVTPMVSQTPTKDEDLENDYIKTRKLKFDLADLANRLAKDAYTFATEAQNARAFEVASNAIKNAAEISEKLLGTHEQIANINSKKNIKEIDIGTQTNNNFYFNTNDLLDKLIERSSEINK